MEAPPPQGCGDSDKWKITPFQIHKEKLVDSYFAFDQNDSMFPEHIRKRVHRKWIEFAFQWADPTYKKYTDGKPIYPPYVTYHHLIHSSNEELIQVAELITSGRGLRDE